MERKEREDAETRKKKRRENENNDKKKDDDTILLAPTTPLLALGIPRETSDLLFDRHRNLGSLDLIRCTTYPS